MSANPPDDSVEPPALTDQAEHPGLDDARYAAFENDDGSVVVYDEANDRAWIESDGAVCLPDMA